MKELIKKHLYTSRSPVSDENNNLVYDVAYELNADIIKSKCGSEVLSWIIPLYWKVIKGQLKDLSGNILIDFKNNPLHLWTNSISFQGRITKQELENHILTDKNRPDLIPYHYKFGFSTLPQNWGFCISYNDYVKMQDNEYIVDIETELHNDNYMMTGVKTIKGKEMGRGTYIFAAHTCHPAIAVDGLTNVIVLMEVFKELEKRNVKNTYKFVFGSEYYAAAAFLNTLNEKEEKTIKGAFFCDLIGADTKPAYSSSFQGDSLIDSITAHIFKHRVKDYSTYGYRQLIGNDEMFYNGPYYNIPTVTLGQNVPAYYHSSGDNYEKIDFDMLETYKEYILDIINILETDYVPVLKYKGPLCLSRYNLYIDFKANPEGYRHIEAAQILADGKTSCFQIAEKTGAEYNFIKNFFDELIKYGLTSKL